MKRYFVPLAVFVVLMVFLAIGLTQKPRELPSALLGKPAPAFVLPTLNTPTTSLSTRDLRGQVWVLNVWASWCVACRDEHATMVEMAKLKLVPIYGLNYKDQRADALGWLARFGNPYVASLSDTDGLVGIDYGVYGVPETFVIDKAGVIRRKFVGPVTAQTVRDEIVPLVARLNS
ncbi:DsbE family thiol:disulfide interchange protein [Rhizobacter sp. Root404]|uniref:DsbE family thiol:disulfide interchange protein n=1 Tax=Rhizobacter sp. Root404 TaxID=1736528 RepID=UPI0006F50031|nr:DsbE family thiol:disulfide interchange protein [Rhizobacter sp. Root404]KQW40349.1 thiol:disulfide interchange protein [Rhizobacter sp. Root404]